MIIGIAGSPANEQANQNPQGQQSFQEIFHIRKIWFYFCSKGNDSRVTNNQFHIYMYLHMTCRRLLLASFFLLIFALYDIQAQNEVAVNPFEEKLKLEFDSLKKITNDEAKRAYNQLIINDVQNFLQDPASYTVTLDSVKFMGKVVSPDNAFRVLNWNIAYSDFSFEYFTFLQFNPQDKQGYRVIRLMDTGLKVSKDLESRQFNSENWYGALIYKILLNTYKKQNYYTMLELDYNNLMSSFKIIDVMTFDKLGNPVFGAPIFKTDKGIRSRVVFEYSAQVSMGLKYDDRFKMIVFDHLSPIRPDLAGDYKFYGPDFSYDGYTFDNGFWVYKADLDITNPVPTTGRGQKK